MPASQPAARSAQECQQRPGVSPLPPPRCRALIPLCANANHRDKEQRLARRQCQTERCHCRRRTQLPASLLLPPHFPCVAPSPAPAPHSPTGKYKDCSCRVHHKHCSSCWLKDDSITQHTTPSHCRKGHVAQIQSPCKSPQFSHHCRLASLSAHRNRIPPPIAPVSLSSSHSSPHQHHSQALKDCQPWLSARSVSGDTTALKATSNDVHPKLTQQPVRPSLRARPSLPARSPASFAPLCSSRPPPRRRLPGPRSLVAPTRPLPPPSSPRPPSPRSR